MLSRFREALVRSAADRLRARAALHAALFLSSADGRDMVRPTSCLALAAALLCLAPDAHAQRARVPAGTPASASAQDSLADAPEARRALMLPGHRWLRRRGASADVYVLGWSAAEHRMRGLAGEAERAIAANLRWLGEPSARARLRLFFVESREQMRPLTGGSTPGGWSVTREGTAFFVANDSVHPAMRHEIMHLLSWRLWGPPGGEWLSEDVASVAGGQCRGWSFEDVAAALDRDRRLVPFDSLRHFVFAGETGAAYYLESAGVVSFIDRTYGRRKLREFWRTGGFGGAEHSLGLSAAVLERRWRASIARQRATTSWPAMWREIHAHGCE